MQQAGEQMVLLLGLEEGYNNQFAVNNKFMINIRIEEVGDINFEHPYLEVFLNENNKPFLEIGVSEEKQLNFKFYPSKTDVLMNVEEWGHILSVAKIFLSRALKNEEDFLNFTDSDSSDIST